MNNVERCPLCNKAPLIATDARGMWIGGCDCVGVVVNQSSYEAAVSQWNSIVSTFTVGKAA